MPRTLIVVVLLMCALVIPARGQMEAPEVELLDAGSEPRTVLRYTPRPGQREVMVMLIRMGMSLDMEGRQMPDSPIPAMRMTMELEVREVAENGDIAYDLRLTKAEALDAPDLDRGVLESAREALGALEGLRGRALVTARGETKEAEFSIPPGAPEQSAAMLRDMERSMTQFSTAFPEEPVGEGARWEATTRPTFQGMKIEQRLRYELKEMRGEEIVLGVRTRMTADPQPITGGEILEYAGSGEGTVRSRLTRLVPTSEISADVKARMRIGEGPRASELKQRVRMTMKITPGEPERNEIR
jgi:hypothetical protein